MINVGRDNGERSAICSAKYKTSIQELFTLIDRTTGNMNKDLSYLAC